MPFAGYKDFDACVRSMSKKIGVYSPKGLCASLERRRNPVVELIQTKRLKNGNIAIEYIDVDDKQKIRGLTAAPGVRLVLNKGKFTAGYAVYVRDGRRWRWVDSAYLVKGRYNFKDGEVTIPDQTGPREKSLVKPALSLLNWALAEKEEHSSLAAIVDQEES